MTRALSLVLVTAALCAASAALAWEASRFRVRAGLVLGVGA